MKKSIYPILCVAVILSACGSPNDQDTATTKDPSAVAETAVPPMDSALTVLLKSFSTTQQLSYTLDAKKMDDVKPGKELKGAEVTLLAKNPVNDELFGSMEYSIKDFLRIDSIKATGKYDEYLEHIDLGEIQESKAYAYSLTKTGPNSCVLFWIQEFHSTEACPYSYAKTMYATAIHNNVIGETIAFAEESGGADAPVSFYRKLSGTMPDSAHIQLNLVEVSDDDEPEKEIVEGTYELSLKEGKFTFVSKDKKAPRKEKKKA